MPGSVDRRSELLARALDDGTTDSADGQLRRELVMVSLLVRAGEPARPDAAARDRMRERIMAGLAAEEFAPSSDGPATTATVVPMSRVRRMRSAAAGVQGRLLVAAAASLCLLAALSAMSLVLARDALPGDALYSVKRSAESAELGLTFGDEPRGFKHLQFATSRVDELEALAARSSPDGGNAASFVTALQAFDTDAAAGSRLLIETATNSGGSELTVLRGWADQQRLRLDGARATMPDRAATRTNGSRDLLARVGARAAALELRLPCLTVTSGSRDEIGLLPAGGVCELAPIGPSGQAPPPTSANRPTRPNGPVIELPAETTGAESTGPLGPFEPQPPLTTTPVEDPSPGEPPPSVERETITIPLPIPPLPSLLFDLLGLKVG